MDIVRLLLTSLPSTLSGILPIVIGLTVNINVNLVIVCFTNKLDFSKCYRGSTYPCMRDIYLAAGR